MVQLRDSCHGEEKFFNTLKGKVLIRNPDWIKVLSLLTNEKRKDFV